MSGKVALITGGAGGIGVEAARLLHAEGARVMLVDRDSNALSEAMSSIGDDSNVATTTADVTDEADVRRYVGETLRRFSSIDFFFNNAGIESQAHPIVETSLEDFMRVQQVNVIGVFLGLKHVLPVLYARRAGSVVITSSVAGLSGTPGLGPYVASKHAVVGLMKVAALEASKFDVRVNSIHPSATNTRMIRSIEQSMGGASKDIRSRFAAAIPLGRYAEPIDIARLVLFLASDESSFISGAQYRIDGGKGA